ncbi:AAA family ATPase [Actinomadura alba]|uniref:AAA family ATPase n=2 Tax=Actinomadura alba TaxID=406431 RepID=A0ABR7LUJ5_9ACTN|nr:AAA family ATPase [Actinomadura alba]
MPPPGYPTPAPAYGGPHPSPYPSGSFYPGAPPAGSQPPPPLEPLPEYAPEQSTQYLPEQHQQPYPWGGQSYAQPQQGDPSASLAAYPPQQAEGPGAALPYAPHQQGEQPGNPYAPHQQGEQPAIPYAQHQQGEQPGNPYAPHQQGEQPGSAGPYGPVQHGEGQAAGPYLPQQGQAAPSPYAPMQQPPGSPAIPGVPQQPAAAGPQTADSLSADTLLRNRRSAPAGGWRRAVYKATAGAIHPGEAPGELRRRELLARARTPVAGGHHRVAVMSLKGGVGKTTTTVGLGASLASLRGDRVIAVDANPDRGTLSDKVRLETAATVRDLLNEREQIQRYADVRAFTSQASSRLEVLASDRDPAVSEAFSEEDYRSVTRVLEHYYSICLTDCGTGLLHSAMAGVLDLADQLVLVSSPSVDGARSASATLDWLEAHEHGDLVRGGVVVLSMVRSRSKSTVDLDRLQQHFESRCRAVVRIPYDPHLEEGAEVELDQLAPATQDAYLVLAATIGDGFARMR